MARELAGRPAAAFVDGLIERIETATAPYGGLADDVAVVHLRWRPSASAGAGASAAAERVTTPQRSARPRRWPALTARRPASPPGRPVLTMQGWFRVVFAVLAVLAVAAVVAVVSLLAAGRQASGDLENDILPAQAQAYRLQGALLDQETGVRGFGITGRRDFLQPYTAGLATEAAAAARLRQLIGDDPQQSADLARLEAAADSWRRSYARAADRSGPATARWAART